MLDLQTQKAVFALAKIEELGISETKLIYILEKLNTFLERHAEYKPRGHELFRTFIEYMLTRNRSNFDSMVLITGDKGTGKSSSGLMFAKFWCWLLGIKFDEKKHIVYSNMQVVDAIDNLPKFSPILCDEAIDFASAQNWNKSENKKLKIKLGKVRTKHMFFILCWPWKINKLDKIYFESYVNYWVDLYKRGKGVVFVKDLNPISDPWKLDYFKKLGSFNEFTSENLIRRNYAKHPNYWNMITIPKPSDKFYERYMKVRESNVYHSSDISSSLTEDDIVRAFIIKAFEDMFMKSGTAKTKRLVKHFQELYQYEIKEKDIKDCFDDSKQIVEKAIENKKYEKYEVKENGRDNRFTEDESSE